MHTANAFRRRCFAGDSVSAHDMRDSARNKEIEARLRSQCASANRKSTAIIAGLILINVLVTLHVCGNGVQRIKKKGTEGMAPTHLLGPAQTKRTCLLPVKEAIINELQSHWLGGDLLAEFVFSIGF